MQPLAAGHRWRAPAPAVASLLLHGLILVLLLSAVQKHRGGAPAAAARRAQSVVITLGPETPPQAPSQPPPKPSPAPQAQPKASNHVAAAKPAKPTAPPRSEPRPAAPTVAPDPNQQIDDVLGSIHDNWLPPPNLKQVFLCHVRIDYLADGTITQITFVTGCGNAMLVDSLRRAIWKTQPLPLSKDKKQAGSMELDLTQ